MSFYDELTQLTAPDRDFLVSAPLIVDALAGRLDRRRYLGFLVQAWHHVRHTVPLLMAVGARLPERHENLRRAVIHYLDEEVGHDAWILNDITAAGGDARAAAASLPLVATDAMVAYAWDTVMRRNPVGFFGMVFVLEGSSVALATRAATAIQASLGLPASAFTYLCSHGELDREHVQDLARILDSLSEPEDRAGVVQCARAIYRLYGAMFRAIDAELATGAERSAA